MAIWTNSLADTIEALNSTSRYLDDLLNIHNPYFERMVTCIYPIKLQLNKANSSYTRASLLDLHLSISNGFVSSKINDKCTDFDFDLVNFLFWDGDFHVPFLWYLCFLTYSVCKSVWWHLANFNAYNKTLTAKLLLARYWYHEPLKTFLRCTVNIAKN